MSLNSSNSGPVSVAGPSAESTPSDSPGSPAPLKTPENPKQPKVSFWKSTGLSASLIGWTFFGFMLAQLIIFAVVSGVQAAGVDLGAFNTIILNTVTSVVIYTIALTIIIGLPWLILRQKTTLTDLGLHRLPHWKDFLWLIAGFVAYLVLTTAITLISRSLFPGADYEQAQDTGFSGLTSQFELILTFVVLVVIAPVAEEVMFRGYLFGKLKKHAKVWVSIVLSSLLFAVVHFQFNVGLDTFALAVVLSLLRVATGSIWSSIMLHMAKNGLAFYFLFVSGLFF